MDRNNWGCATSLAFVKWPPESPIPFCYAAGGRGIGAKLAAFDKAYGKGTRTRKLSASARARVAAAQRARWAKVRETAKVVPLRGKRTLSAAARRKIAAAQRARWGAGESGKENGLIVLGHLAVEGVAIVFEGCAPYYADRRNSIGLGTSQCARPVSVMMTENEPV